MTSINYERFEELNNEYEKIFSDLKKKIKDLKNENKELHKGSIIIIENLQDDKEELLYKIEKIKEEKYEVKERFNELSNMIIFLGNWFGQAFDNAHNIFYNYYKKNIDNDIYIDHKNPLPTIFGERNDNSWETESESNYSDRMSIPDIYDDEEFDD